MPNGKPKFIAGQAKPLYVLSMRHAPRRRRIDWPLVGLAIFLALLGVAGRIDYEAAQQERAAYQQNR